MKIELRHICKRFGRVRANDSVTASVPSGTIRGLLGENGAGKSTLMKILSGFLQPDSGEILLDGRPVRLTSPAQAVARGIGMLHQDPLDFPPLSVLDNFLLDRGGPLVPDRGLARRQLASVAAELGFSLPPHVAVSTLSPGERQQLEIVRLLSRGVQTLIFDEPTSAISAEQRASLFAALHRLAGRGRTVMFVSHKLAEVEALCDHVTVLARGTVAGDVTMPCPSSALVRLMFGRGIAPAERLAVEPGRSVLRVEGLMATDGRVTLRGLSLEVRAGEVVGLAGLEGSGQRLLLRACAGLTRTAQGRVSVGGQPITGASYRRFLGVGGAYVPAARLEEGLVPGMTLLEHVGLADRRPRWLVDWKALAKATAERINDFAILGTPGSRVEALSGGNQQRALLALLPAGLTVLFMEHPTRGLDLEATEDVWRHLYRRRGSGTAVLFTSSDVDELLGRSDRILVFCSGRVSRPFNAVETTVEHLGELIGGEGLA
jgi:general nucleoside transport system ATP-binding protein